MQTTVTSVGTKKKLNLSMKFQKKLPTDNFISKYLYNKKALKKLESLGLDTHLINYRRESHVEIVATGEKEKLWELIKWSRTAPLFHRIKEVNFQFVDVVEVEVA